jgi:hypothetical protein
MSPYPQLDCDRFRILLIRKETRELLVWQTAEGLALPVLEIPRYSRPAEELTAAIDRQWGMKAFSLGSLAGDSVPGGLSFHVAELVEPSGGSPNAMTWASLTPFASERFADHRDRVAVETASASFELEDRGFTRPGSFATISEWVSTQAASIGVELRGRFRQRNASAGSSLVRFETTGPALWFKAVGTPHLAECAITRKLAQLCPGALPRVVASNLEWNAWLSVEAEGVPLAKTSQPSDWQSVASALGQLQMASYGHGLHLLSLGAKDLRPHSLLGQVEPFFARMTERMAAQTAPAPAPLTAVELVALAGEVRTALEALGDSEIPGVLNHLDCNPGNILVSGKDCVFLDWAEGAVGHPLFTFQYLLELRRKFHGRDDKAEDELLAAYTAPWTPFFSPEAMAVDLPLIPLLAVFAYAASASAESTAPGRPEATAFFRSLARRMKREVNLISERKSLCIR